ncbi:B3 domain-containing protein Os03g0619800-like isoform X2 [Lotus japonicus]|uniref:B3 domain-containing protein Os03g0619800-like isoform X2 n=1 Tax=Lotus japonicus TaxID=34305 RepID=UPI0025904C36|nr:B3 domain-containing protein Os03g0619800-like isoform X2 [Lotus japonicus]
MAPKFPLENPTTHFFKIITLHDHEGKLMIPRAFVEKYGEGLPKTVFVKPPNGAEWKLDLVKSDGEIWFQKGWKEFAEHHSLAHGHLLLFRYGGTSHFQLRIFAMNALEINYPVKTVECKRASDAKGKKPANNENSEDYKEGRKRKANLSLEVLQPCKMETGGCVKAGSAFKFRKTASPHTDKMCKGKQVITAKQVTALERASSFKICNPSFLIFMHPSYIRGYMNLPPEFCLRHLDLSKPQGVFNLLLNGRVWTAGYVIWKTKIALSSRWRAFVTDNKLKVGDVCTFELIAKTNNTFQVHIFRESDNASCSTSQVSDLRAGQKREANLLSESLRPCKVGRSRCARVGNSLKLQKGASSSTDKKCLGKEGITAKQVTALDRARSFKICNPSVLIFMYPSYIIHGQLNLPSNFCLRHLDLRKPRGFINLEMLNGTVSTVKYLIKKSNTQKKIVLGRGWKAFVKDNNLKVGDVCSFELIAKTCNTFQVHIFRESDNANCPTSQDIRGGIKRKANLSSESLQPCKVGRSRCAKVGNSLKLKKGASFSTDKRCQGKQVIAAKQVTALDRASSFKTCNPSFLIFMRPTYVTRGEMNLPARFCLQHLDLSKPKGDINLGVVNGRVWTVKYLIRKSKRRVKIVLPSRGWRVFVKDNNLKVGDVCTFELIVSTNNTFLVHIFRESDNANSPTSQESVKVEELVKD